eukprot:8992646-Ditylum_brightwellii.AAC.1
MANNTSSQPKHMQNKDQTYCTTPNQQRQADMGREDNDMANAEEEEAELDDFGLPKDSDCMTDIGIVDSTAHSNKAATVLDRSSRKSGTRHGGGTTTSPSTHILELLNTQQMHRNVALAPLLSAVQTA